MWTKRHKNLWTYFLSRVWDPCWTRVGGLWERPSARSTGWLWFFVKYANQTRHNNPHNSALVHAGSFSSSSTCKSSLESIPFFFRSAQSQWTGTTFSFWRFMCAISHRSRVWSDDHHHHLSFKVENRFNPSLELADQRGHCSAIFMQFFVDRRSFLCVALNSLRFCLPIFNFNRLNPIDFTFFLLLYICDARELTQSKVLGLQCLSITTNSPLLTPMQRASDQR